MAQTILRGHWYNINVGFGLDSAEVTSGVFLRRVATPRQNSAYIFAVLDDEAGTAVEGDDTSKWRAVQVPVTEESKKYFAQCTTEQTEVMDKDQVEKMNKIEHRHPTARRAL